MPCKIRIKENLTEVINREALAAEGKSLHLAQKVAKNINAMFNADVISFYQSGDYIDKNIHIPDSLVNKYYENELSLEKSEITEEPKAPDQIDLENDTRFGLNEEGESDTTDVMFNVPEIPSSKASKVTLE